MLLALCFVLGGCASSSRVYIRSHDDAATNRFEFTQPQMGLPFRIVVYAPDAASAQDASRAAFARIAELNDILSDYDADSELSRLSRTSGSGRAVPVSEDLWRMLERSHALSDQTDGAFDITVGPYVNLWRKARRERKLPAPERLAEARAAVGWRNVELDARSRSATLRVPNMRLDLGAIAKGYAVDEALKVLRGRGLTRALIAGGGDMVAGDSPPGKAGWRVEVAPLDVTDAPPSVFVLLSRAALATSGDVFQHLEIEGRRYSHIVDPRTGLGLIDHSLVTIIAPDCTTADSLATAVSVMGPERGWQLVERTRGVAAHLVRQPDKEIEARESRLFRRYKEKQTSH